jgi:ADP-ribose pyrophosphatase YjhB (NUDIX family)
VNARTFCPFCAARLGPIDGGRQACSGCGRPFYHAASPCVAVLVEDGAGRVLLARRGIEPAIGCWDLPGGFVEPGEVPEDAVVREIREETGIEVAVAGFLGHVVDRYGDDGDQTLNCVFVARPVHAASPEPADDVAALEWFSADDLPARDELAFANTAEALDRWRRRSR